MWADEEQIRIASVSLPGVGPATKSEIDAQGSSPELSGTLHVVVDSSRTGADIQEDFIGLDYEKDIFGSTPSLRAGEVIKNTTVRLDVTRYFTTGRVLRLEAPSLSSTADVTFAGRVRSQDGTWTVMSNEVVSREGRAFTVKEPCGSAAVVKFDRAVNLVAHMGLTTKGKVGAKTAMTLDDAVEQNQAIHAAATEVRADILVLCHGGPITEPEEVDYVFRKSMGIAGFFSASSVERLPAERAITEQVRQFKGISAKWDRGVL